MAARLLAALVLAGLAPGHSLHMSRRSLVGGAAAAGSFAIAGEVLAAASGGGGSFAPEARVQSLAGRFRDLEEWRPERPRASPPGGVLRFPPWLCGTWRVRCRAERFTLPRGPTVVDRDTIVAAIDEFQEQTETSYLTQYRAAGADGTCVQDRAFNAREELNGFSGFETVRQVSYEPPRAGAPESLRISVAPDNRLEELEDAEVIRIDVQRAEWAAPRDGPAVFYTRELLRQRVFEGDDGGDALEDADFESVIRFERASDTEVRAQNRLIKYLRPGFGAYDTTKDDAVAIFDYVWQLDRQDSAAFGSLI